MDEIFLEGDMISGGGGKSDFFLYLGFFKDTVLTCLVPKLYLCSMPNFKDIIRQIPRQGVVSI